MSAYCGGITHGNILYLNQVLENVWSFDFASSYPYIMTCFKLPQTPFRVISDEQYQIYKKNDSHAFLFHVKFTNVKSKYFNHFIPYYKMAAVQEDEKACIDNGRLSFIKGSFEMILTDYDFDMIKQCYDIEKIEIYQIWASYKDYLEPEILDFIITKYAHKTTLKHVKGQEAFYQKEKEELNSMYGISCQNILKTGIYLDLEDPDLWCVEGLDEEGDITEEFAEKKLKDMRRSYSTLFYPMACGVWITSIAKCNLFKNVIKLDEEVIYYDTDSIKGIGDNVFKVVEEYNKEVEENIRKSAEYNDIPIEKFKPYDINGHCHPIGYFENETLNEDTGELELYKKFKTLGAKKYMYQTADGVNHLTMSGVRKKAVEWLDFDTFCRGTELSYEATKKLLRLYEDNQQPFKYKDVDGNIYKCEWQHTIILQPTTFKIGQTDDLLALIAHEQGFMTDIL